MSFTALQSAYIHASANTTNIPSDAIALTNQPSRDISAPQTSSINENDLTKKAVSSIWGVEVNACRFDGDEAHRLAKEGVLIGSDSADNYLVLDAGNVLLHPEKDMIIKTKEGEAHVRSGASIFISQSEEGAVFYDLAQTQSKQISIKVSTNKQKVLLEPGQMLVLTHQNTGDFEKLTVDCHRIEYNNVSQFALQNNQVKAFKANFSVASAMAIIEPLRTSIKSANGHDLKVTDKLVKGTVIMGGFAAMIPETASPQNNSSFASNSQSNL